MTKKIPKILLLNYSAQEADRVSKELSIEVHRGYLADSGTYEVDPSGVSSSVIDFYIPESFAEFQAVFINFDIADKIKSEFKGKATSDYKEKGKHFLSDYWLYDRGYLVVFTGKDLINLPNLGIPLKTRAALQTDKTARLGIKSNEDNPLRSSLEKQLKNIKMPASHYISPQDDKEIKEYLESGHLDRAYTNSSSKAIGVYIDKKKDADDYGWEDFPQVMVLPSFKSLPNITISLTRTFSMLSPKFIPLSDTEWKSNDTYYPKSISGYQEQIKETELQAQQKIEELKKAKTIAIEDSAAYMKILTESGDELVEAVQWLLSKLLGLTVIDVDKGEEKGKRKEDLLITQSDGTKILAEVKGTKSEYPSPKYIGQATNHFIRKASLGAKKCLLIVNHDYETEPDLRNKAYTGEDEELLKSVEYVSYLDTRVLHRVCLDVANGVISEDEAVAIITDNGRIEYLS